VADAFLSDATGIAFSGFSTARADAAGCAFSVADDACESPAAPDSLAIGGPEDEPGPEFPFFSFMSHAYLAAVTDQTI